MQRFPIHQVVAGATLWLVVCIAGGFVVLSRLGDYGSIVQPLIGGVMGILGAAAHGLLCVSSRFRRSTVWARGFLNWLGACLPLLALAATFTRFEMAACNPDFWPELARTLLLHTGGRCCCWRCSSQR